MNPVVPSPEFQSSSKEILVLTSNAEHRSDLADTASQLSEYQLRTSSDFTTSLLHLRNRLQRPGEGTPLSAVLLAYADASAQDFRLLRAVVDLTRHVGIPVFLFTREIPEQTAEARLIGASDLLRLPLDARILRKRMEFFRKNALVKRTVTKPTPAATKLRWDKRAFDIVGASVGLFVLSPLLAITALAIYIDGRGAKIFYTSKRVGSDYRIFDFLKFRSMIPNADKRVQELQKQNSYGGDASPFFKMKNDPRVTPIGRFIRRYSIDELPQLWNVLRGEMSIVGNRPLPMREAEQLTADHSVHRFLAPAGLTGLWQIAPEGKDNVTPERRIELDIEYANNYSLMTDLKIIFKTLPAMIQGGEGKKKKKASTTRQTTNNTKAEISPLTAAPQREIA